MPVWEAWANYWFMWVCIVFMKAYLEASGEGEYLPRQKDEIRILLDNYLLEKAIYEIGYELNNRPDWVKIPLQGILHLLQGTK
jgi:maltose alpha-D-glucosyltransferase/alpha-amylase